MSFEQSNNSQSSQPDSFRSSNVEDTTQYSMQSSPTRPRAPRDLVSRGILGSLNNGSESGEQMLQQPVDWIAAQISLPTGKPHPDKHELCSHEDLFCVHAPNAFGASENNSTPAGSFLSTKEEPNNGDSRVYIHRQPTIKNHPPAIVTPQVSEPLQPNLARRRQHQAHHLVVPGTLNGNGEAQLPPHIQTSSSHLRHMQQNGSPHFQGHGYTQSTDIQLQKHSGAGTSVQFDPGMYNM
jgi:hypothetical protein